MEWKKQYLKALIEALNPQGDVLQVGFHSHECIQEIQSFELKSHTLIENDPKVLVEARKWAPTVKIIEKSWKNALSELGIFHTLLFHCLSSDQKENKKAKSNVSFHQSNSSSSLHGIGSLAFSQAKETINMVENMFPSLHSIQYSDADIDAFLQMSDPALTDQLFLFLNQLKKSGQISEEQWERAVRQHKKTDEIPEDPLVLFLQHCLQSHMSKGSIASWLSASPTSKHDCPLFFEHIVTHPDVDYQEKMIPLEGREVLVMTVQKLASI